MAEVIEFTRGVPPPESIPVDRLAQCAQYVLKREAQGILQYANARGFLPLREWVSSQHNVSAEQVLLGQGSLQLLDHLIRLLVKPGDSVLIENPTYDRVLTLIRRAGGLPVGIPLKNDGVDLDILEAKLNTGQKPVFLYIIPDFQNPSGSCMTYEKRAQLAALAKRYNLLIVEDMPYRKLRYTGEGIETLFSMCPESVIAMSSFSKLISPGLRVGYMIATKDLQTRLAKFAEETYINASYLNQAMVMEFIHRSWLNEQLDSLKNLYRSRLSTLLTSLEENFNGLATWTKPQGGFFVSLMLNGEEKARKLLSCTDFGLKLTDGRGFFTEGGENFIRLPFCALTEEQLNEGVKRLYRLIE